MSDFRLRAIPFDSRCRHFWNELPSRVSRGFGLHSRISCGISWVAGLVRLVGDTGEQWLLLSSLAVPPVGRGHFQRDHRADCCKSTTVASAIRLPVGGRGRRCRGLGRAWSAGSNLRCSAGTLQRLAPWRPASRQTVQRAPQSCPAAALHRSPRESTRLIPRLFPLGIDCSPKTEIVRRRRPLVDPFYDETSSARCGFASRRKVIRWRA
jgi:hypothetical protein